MHYWFVSSLSNFVFLRNPSHWIFPLFNLYSFTALYTVCLYKCLNSLFLNAPLLYSISSLHVPKNRFLMVSRQCFGVSIPDEMKTVHACCCINHKHHGVKQYTSCYLLRLWKYRRIIHCAMKGQTRAKATVPGETSNGHQDGFCAQI